MAEATVQPERIHAVAPNTHLYAIALPTADTHSLSQVSELIVGHPPFQGEVRWLRNHVLHPTPNPRITFDRIALTGPDGVAWL